MFTCSYINRYGRIRGGMLQVSTLQVELLMNRCVVTRETDVPTNLVGCLVEALEIA